MGGKVLECKSDKVLNKGKKEGFAQVKKVINYIRKNPNVSDEEVAQFFRVKQKM